MSTKMKRIYIGSLMYYIEQEYDNVPEEVTPEMEKFFLRCFENLICFPNAAGAFAKKFLKANKGV